MVQIELADIAATPGQIWPFISDPVNMAIWNPKLVSIDRNAAGSVSLGERYSALFRMNGKERVFQVEVTHLEPFHSIQYQYTLADKPGRYVVETLTLMPHNDQIRVEQLVDLRHAGLPLPIRVLGQFITRFGWAAEKPYLDRLKDAVEAETISHSSNLFPRR